MSINTGGYRYERPASGEIFHTGKPSIKNLQQQLEGAKQGGEGSDKLRLSILIQIERLERGNY